MYSVVPGHLDLAGGSQYGRRYSVVPGHLDLGIPVWEKVLGSPGTLTVTDIVTPTYGDPSGEVNSNLSILVSTLTKVGVSGHGWRRCLVYSSLVSETIMSHCLIKST